ncbi:MAG TPA: hypothetical protein VGG26_05140 [Terracidiphilus sp.]|jgi:hypothetical protein
MADTGKRTTIPLLDQAVTVSMLGSALYFGLVYVVTRYSYRVNVGFGLACSLLLALCGLIFVGFGYQFIRETQAGPDDTTKPFLIPIFEKFSGKKLVFDLEAVRRFEISVFIPVFTLFVASWTSLAYGFARLSPGAYAHPERLSFGLMLRHYLWQVVDMVPLIDAWKSVHIDDPLLETRLWPGILVVLFRLIVLYIVLSAAAKLLGLDRRKKSHEG